jgi:hypothetical protein
VNEMATFGVANFFFHSLVGHVGDQFFQPNKLNMSNDQSIIQPQLLTLLEASQMA